MENQKEAVIMLGLPASGKSTYIKKFWDTHSDFRIVSADDIRLAHPDYNPQKPDVIHQECVSEAEDMVYELAERGLKIIMDGGGINTHYTFRIVTRLKSLGYIVRVVYINTPVSVCLDRNDTRRKNRERFVPSEEIIKKYYKLNDCIDKLNSVCDEFIEVKHFTDKYIFVDMDGVVSEHQDLPVDYCGNVDFISNRVFQNAKPVKEVIEHLKVLSNGSNIYIVSASPNSVCSADKSDWILRHMPFIPQCNIYFAGNKDFKVVMLEHLINHLKLDPKDCTYIEDDHRLLEQAKRLNINAMHPSKFLARY